jgi:altronate hydrolase
MAAYALTEKAVILRPEDDVAVAKAELTAGTVLDDGGHRIEVRQDIKPGHKVARRAVATGAPVRRYGQVIGFATRDIAVGDHVHTQNLGIGDLGADRYEIGVDVRPVEFYPPERMRTFDGFKREDGRVGTRNYVAVISGVNCSASVSQFVKDPVSITGLVAGAATSSASRRAGARSSDVSPSRRSSWRPTR